MLPSSRASQIPATPPVSAATSDNGITSAAVSLVSCHLVAPRAVLSTEGTQDAWTNPEGAQLTHVAAKKVYGFLKTGDKISIRFRPVGHVPSNDDLLDYADYVFHNKPLLEEFGKLPYQEDKSAFTWDVPK